MTLRAQKVESPGDRHPALRCHRTLLLRNRHASAAWTCASCGGSRRPCSWAWPEGSFDLALYVVTRPEITRLNEAFLRHKGPTDVITFDYSLEQASRLSGDRRDACPLARSSSASRRQCARLAVSIRPGKANWSATSFTECCICLATMIGPGGPDGDEEGGGRLAP